jgi:hypothetical protein
MTNGWIMPDSGYTKCLTCSYIFSSTQGIDAYGPVGESQCWDCFWFKGDQYKALSHEEWLDIMDRDFKHETEIRPAKTKIDLDPSKYARLKDVIIKEDLNPKDKL